jgi:hypothetical protein
VNLGTYSSIQIWQCILVNGFGLLLDVGRIGTLSGITWHYILPPFFPSQAIRAGICGEKLVVIWSGFVGSVHMVGINSIQVFPCLTM